MAAVGLVRGSADFSPLTSEGVAQAKALGKSFSRRGGLTCLYVSTALRARQTANAIIDANPTTEPEEPSADLLSWRMGGLEGSPSIEAQPKILALVKYLPSQAPNGKSDITGLIGESFDDFRNRALGYLTQQFLEWDRNKKLKLGIVGHHRVLKLLDAWIAAGMSPLHTVDADRFASLKEIGEPSGVWRVCPGGKNGAWQLVPFDVNGSGDLPASVYYIRHAKTAQNSGGYSGK